MEELIINDSYIDECAFADMSSFLLMSDGLNTYLEGYKKGFTKALHTILDKASNNNNIKLNIKDNTTII